MIPFVRILKYNNKAAQPKSIKKITGNTSNVFVLLSSGILYARGANTNGMFGLGNATVQSTWIQISSSVANVWCGMNTTLIQKTDGTYLYSGTGAGAGQSASVQVFTDISAMFNTLLSTTGATLKQLSMGSSWVSVLLSNDTIYGTGTNGAGQIGNGTTTAVTGTFSQATIPTGIIPATLQCSYLSSAFISTTGRLYYTGSLVGLTAAAQPASSYNVFTLSTVTASSSVQFYFNTQYGLSNCLTTTASGSVLWNGGQQQFGQMGDGVSSTDYKVFGAATAQPTGTYYTAAKGMSYYSSHIVTSTGIWACGINSGSTTAAGKLGVNTTTNTLNYTLCPLPASGMDLSSITVVGGLYRTYMTDGNFVYSTGMYVTQGGVSSTVFTLDDPRS